MAKMLSKHRLSRRAALPEQELKLKGFAKVEPKTDLTGVHKCMVSTVFNGRALDLAQILPSRTWQMYFKCADS